MPVKSRSTSPTFPYKLVISNEQISKKPKNYIDFPTNIPLSIPSSKSSNRLFFEFIRGIYFPITITPIDNKLNFSQLTVNLCMEFIPKDKNIPPEKVTSSGTFANGIFWIQTVRAYVEGKITWTISCDSNEIQPLFHEAYIIDDDSITSISSATVTSEEVNLDKEKISLKDLEDKKSKLLKRKQDSNQLSPQVPINTPSPTRFSKRLKKELSENISENLSTDLFNSAELNNEISVQEIDHKSKEPKIEKEIPSPRSSRLSCRLESKTETSPKKIRTRSNSNENVLNEAEIKTITKELDDVPKVEKENNIEEIIKDQPNFPSITFSNEITSSLLQPPDYIASSLHFFLSISEYNHLNNEILTPSKRINIPINLNSSLIVDSISEKNSKNSKGRSTKINIFSNKFISTKFSHNFLPDSLQWCLSYDLKVISPQFITLFHYFPSIQEPLIINPQATSENDTTTEYYRFQELDFIPNNSPITTPSPKILDKLYKKIMSPSVTTIFNNILSKSPPFITSNSDNIISILRLLFENYVEDKLLFEDEKKLLQKRIRHQKNEKKRLADIFGPYHFLRFICFIYTLLNGKILNIYLNFYLNK